MTENDMKFAFVSIKKVSLEFGPLKCLCIVCCHVPTALAESRSCGKVCGPQGLNIDFFALKEKVC